ncbi:glycolate oxidase subunit GlcE [Thiohalomonas denitrificans]|uniref:Glycolate oxidase FAD binding subunit n=1 Tax=Thiohalomonas denitrificans TaxID=415747 RepID=A0A1G5QI63_9GAMM|nr:glycolate oxidase subunit GlcE [Thiohalomonas denitrificans]SCZ61286.1 glycolate oxidase FAD binding subunit [Thiohalomonas denitrificans]
MTDVAESITARVRLAYETGEPLAIEGGGSKRFFGRRAEGKPLSVSAHRGVIGYEPRELVITARAGTPLSEIEEILEREGQMLPFEPPHFGNATLGGSVACGLSGPRRPYTGAVRDFLLGTEIVNGRGQRLCFGGEVIKNVAGYDLSRTMAGALGTLGVLLSVSLKVLPRPEQEITLARSCSPEEGLECIHRWSASPLPISAACHTEGQLRVRLSGSPEAVHAARDAIGGDVGESTSFWSDLREQRLPFFAGDAPLWRLSVPADAPLHPLTDGCLIDWGGAQRWVRSDAPAEEIHAAAVAMGGHAQRFRGGDREESFQPPAAAVMRLHEKLKAAFDPVGILNPGRLYATL